MSNSHSFRLFGRRTGTPKAGKAGSGPPPGEAICGHPGCGSTKVLPCAYQDRWQSKCGTYWCGKHVSFVGEVPCCPQHAPLLSAVVTVSTAKKPQGNHPTVPIPIQPEPGKGARTCSVDGCSNPDLFPCSYRDQDGRECGSWWCGDHVEYVGQNRFCHRHASLVGSITGTCAMPGCDSHEVWLCSYRDRHGRECASTWCREHTRFVGAVPFCEEHAGLIGTLSVHHGSVREIKTLPTLDDRCASLAEFVSDEVHEQIIGLLQQRYAGRPDVQIMADERVRDMWYQTQLVWWRTWGALTNAGYLTRIAIWIPMVAPPVTPTVHVLVDSNIVFKQVPDWIIRDQRGEAPDPSDLRNFTARIVESVYRAVDMPAPFLVTSRPPGEPLTPAGGFRTPPPPPPPPGMAPPGSPPETAPPYLVPPPPPPPYEPATAPVVVPQAEAAPAYDALPPPPSGPPESLQDFPVPEQATPPPPVEAAAEPLPAGEGADDPGPPEVPPPGPPVGPRPWPKAGPLPSPEVEAVGEPAQTVEAPSVNGAGPAEHLEEAPPEEPAVAPAAEAPFERLEVSGSVEAPAGVASPDESEAEGPQTGLVAVEAPASEPDASGPPDAAPAPSVPGPAGRRVIIVAEDERTAADVRGVAIQVRGIDVVGVSLDPIQALDDAARLSPEVALVHVKLSSTAGLWLAERFGSELPGMPVVLLTEDGSSVLLRGAHQAGARDVLVWPYSPEELEATILRVLPEAPAVPALPPPAESTQEAADPPEALPVASAETVEAEITTPAGADIPQAGPRAEALTESVLSEPVQVDTAPPPQPAAPPDVPIEVVAPTMHMPTLEPPARPEPVEAPVSAGHRGEVTVIFSGKGGVGKSLIAANMAAAIAEACSTEVGLVDLDLQFGDLGLMLNLKPNTTISNVVDSYPDLDSEYLAALMPAGAAGIRLLSGPPSPELADLVTPEHVKAVLEGLRTTFRHIVVDLGAHLDDRSLEAVSVADQILLITDLDLSTIKNARLALTLFDRLSIPPDRVFVVLNRSDARTPVTPDQVEQNLKHPVSAQIPTESAFVQESVHRATPMVKLYPEADLSRALRELVAQIGYGTR